MKSRTPSSKVALLKIDKVKLKWLKNPLLERYLGTMFVIKIRVIVIKGNRSKQIHTSGFL